MELFDRAKEVAVGLVTKVAGHGGSGEHAQTVTIGRARDEVDALWRDPDLLSSVFGDAVTIRMVEGGVFEWKLSSRADETDVWRSKLVEAGDSLRFVTDDKDATDEGSKPAELVVSSREAPSDLGTELTLRSDSGLPAVFTKTFLFRALYRARALVQTGEVPTLAHNPSARDSAH
ncbi:hypothetical protein [Rhodococcus qingshengii]|uniref:hypothetical protein n=1 Tax=Rhodococcus TaxID=1827 RepID=UPI001BA87606|nr:hypothetical protein [Rhodococcus qingshengii]MBS3693880.1 hypothetical protein [Rhodococcus qingshengii]